MQFFPLLVLNSFHYRFKVKKKWIKVTVGLHAVEGEVYWWNLCELVKVQSPDAKNKVRQLRIKTSKNKLMNLSKLHKLC